MTLKVMSTEKTFLWAEVCHTATYKMTAWIPYWHLSLNVTKWHHLSLHFTSILNSSQVFVSHCHSVSNLLIFFFQTSQIFPFFPFPIASAFAKLQSCLAFLTQHLFLLLQTYSLSMSVMVNSGGLYDTVTQVTRLTGAIWTCAWLTIEARTSEHGKLHTGSGNLCPRVARVTSSHSLPDKLNHMTTANFNKETFIITPIIRWAHMRV